MKNKKKFTKRVLNLDEKIELLEKRGLIFENKKDAKHDIQNIWYFRMTGYFKFFQNKETNVFVEWTTFKQVFDLYIFDRKLRLLTLDAIEKIEVSLKANISDYLSEKYGVFWYLNETLFSLETDWKKNIYNNFMKKIISLQWKSASIFIKEYFKKYEDEFLPSWMLFEELTIWEISNIYRNLDFKLAQNIADSYDVYYIDLKKWFQLLVNIRNISAHHSRLWNKAYIIKPRILDAIFRKKFLIKNKDKRKEVIPNYYNTVLIINYLLRNINKNFSWLDDLEKLFDEYPNVAIIEMWFVRNNWRNNFE